MYALAALSHIKTNYDLRLYYVHNIIEIRIIDSVRFSFIFTLC